MRMCCDAMKKRWHIISDEGKNVRQLSEQLHISPILAQLLIHRGVTSAECGRHFLYDSLENSYDPFLMKGMDRAVARICRAIEEKEKIIIYGDYDVDGITATSLLYLVLSDLGAAPSFYIPERQSEGYGLNKEAVQHLKDENASLLITVDCGISSYDIVDSFRRDIDIIVTDHHEPPADIPPAYAVLNPKQEGCAYPFKELAGAGVAYKLCQALWLRTVKEPLTRYTEIAALGTIADLVPLIGENRIIVRHGLERMKEGYNTGLQALLAVSGVNRDAVNAGRIAFTAAPRLNASGRISHAEKGVQLLLTSDAVQAESLAETLNELNKERQDIEHHIVSQAVQQIEQDHRGRDGVLIAYGENWHAGVIGIAASRLVETYYRPSLVISVHDGIGKGSCRSIAGFNMYEALHYADDLLIQYGGHPMAAGFSIQADRIDALRQRLLEYAADHMTDEDYIPQLSIDGEIKANDITLSLIEELSQLEPYGMGNSRPVFSLRNCIVDEARTVGRDKTHLRLILRGERRIRLTGIGWSMAEACSEIMEGDVIDVAFQLERNDFNGISSPQLVIQDLRGPDVPIHLDRAVMIDIYLALKKCIPEWGMPIWQVQQRMLAAEGDRYEAHAVYAAIRVLKEIGVLKIRSDIHGPSYYFPVLSGKMCLHMSPTYEKYSKT